MNRKDFLKSILLLPFSALSMKLNAFGNLTADLESTDQMPVLFMGHGSPMNAIEENEFVTGWRIVGKSLPTPKAILCISAHWETRGTFVTAMERPKTIHDFGGFPKELFDVQYPAPGDPQLAIDTKSGITKTAVGLDQNWGLDHGCWSVVKRLYPNADIPVLQLSIDYTQPPQYHYDLAKELSFLRKKGILIIGSGNMVHNLGILDWQKPNGGYDWAIEANSMMKQYISEDNHAALINYSSQGRAFNLSIPTPEHYLPLIYTLALKDKNEELSIFNDKTVMGSIAMTSLRIGKV